MKTKTNFSGIKTIMWAFCLFRIPAFGEKPPSLPKATIITENDMKKRLKYSTARPVSASSVHFTKRCRVAGSTVAAHLQMKSNYSDIPHHVLEACKVPDLMHTKVGEILKFEKKQLESEVQLNTVKPEAEKKRVDVHYEVQRRYDHYLRVETALRKRCNLHLREIVDYSHTWINRYNNHGLELEKDPKFHTESVVTLQKDDAAAFLRAEEQMAPTTNVSDLLNSDVSQSQSRDWRYWFEKRKAGQWLSFPVATHEMMPKTSKGQVDYVLWNEITNKVEAEMQNYIARNPENSSEQPIALTPTKRPTEKSSTDIPVTTAYSLPINLDHDRFGNLNKDYIDGLSPVEFRDYMVSLDSKAERNFYRTSSTSTTKLPPLTKDMLMHLSDYYQQDDPSAKSKWEHLDTYRQIPSSTRTDYNEVLNRPPRQILWLLGAAVLAIGSLIYSHTQVRSLADVGNHNTQSTIKNINELDHRMLIQKHSIRMLNATVNILERNMKQIDIRLSLDELITECQIAMENVFTDLDRILRGLAALTRNFLTPDLVSMEGLERALLELRDRMDHMGFILALDKLEHVFLQPLSYILFGNGTLISFVHIGAYRKSNVFTVWEFNPVPFLMDDGGNMAITITPETNLIGVSDDDSRHVLLTQQDLDKCSEVAGTRVCHELSIVNTKAKKSCLSSLFMSDVEGIKALCTHRAVDKSEYIVQINTNEYLAYFTEPENIKITCDNGVDYEEKRAPVQGLTHLTLQGGCRAYTSRHVVEGRMEFSLDMPSFQMSTLNISDLFNTPDFTITPAMWQRWQTILKLVGSDRNIPFRDVSSMYERYTVNESWEFGIRALLAIIIPIVVVVILWFARDKIYKAYKKCKGQKKSDTALPPVYFSRNQLQLGPPLPPPNTSGDSRAGSQNSFGASENPTSFRHREVTRTPRSSRRYVDKAGWSKQEQEQILANAERIVLADVEEEEEETNRRDAVVDE